MTTRRLFECNLCHSPTIDEDGRGFSWYTTAQGETIEWSTTMVGAENHICNRCIRALYGAIVQKPLPEIK